MFALPKYAKSVLNTELDSLGIFGRFGFGHCPNLKRQIAIKIQILQKHPKRDKGSRKRKEIVQKVQTTKSA